MANDSFDPKQWHAGPTRTFPRDKIPDEDGVDFWRAAAARPTNVQPAVSAVRIRPPGIGRQALSLGLALAIFGAGAAFAWVERIEPPARAGERSIDPATLPSDAASELVERALNISDMGQLNVALVQAGITAQDAAAVTTRAASALGGNGDVRVLIVLARRPSGITLQTLRASHRDGSGVVLQRDDSGGYGATEIQADLAHEVRVLRGELDSESFYSSAVAAGLVDTLIPEFINAFAYDFNLASEVSPGDTFEVAYDQEVNGSGEAVGPPRLLFASLTTPAKSLALYRYRNSGGDAGWFDGNGASTKRGLMRTPVDGARITSKFGMRFHPVLHYTRLHGGVDFAAPIGTPIYAAANGSVTSASPNACAGNMVILHHDNGWETRYFHLSRYAEGLHAGEQVLQGSTIGFIGSTGSCTTGPHLHFEVHINGEKVDPLSIPSDDSRRERMGGAALAGFMRERNRIDIARARQSY